MNEALNDWFAREILVHEALFVRYLARTWPNREEIHNKGIMELAIHHERVDQIS